MKRNKVNRSVRRRAFTLLEVLMVIVILGVLAALIVPQFVGTGERAKADLTRTQVTSALSTPLELFRTHTGRYPTSDEGLIVLLELPDDDEIADKWSGPYVKSASSLRDAWDSDLIYAAPGEYNESSYDLSSPGPNKIEGDDDDITNWEKV